MKIFTNFYYLPPPPPNLINIYNKTKSNGETRKKIPSSPRIARVKLIVFSIETSNTTQIYYYRYISRV